MDNVNRIIFARMSEEVYLEIPKEIRDKITDFRVERDDFNELKEDKEFCKLYKEYKKAKDDFNKHKFNLRNK